MGTSSTCEQQAIVPQEKTMSSTSYINPPVGEDRGKCEVGAHTHTQKSPEKINAAIVFFK